MPKVKFRLNRDGVADLLRGPDVARTVTLETGRVANAAGRGFEGERLTEIEPADMLGRAPLPQCANK